MLIKLKETGEGKRFYATGEDIEFNCLDCGVRVTEGFYCDFRAECKLKCVLCEECQEKFNMRKCIHDKRGEHEHIKFIRSKHERANNTKDNNSKTA